MTEPLSSYFEKLPAGFSLRSTTADDVEACTQLVRAVDLAACGETTTTVAELEGDILHPLIVRHESSVVIEHDGNIVALLTCFIESADNRNIFFDFFINPAMDLDLAKEISLASVRATEHLTAAVATSLQRDSEICKTALYEADAAFLLALKERNFDYHRTFWRMSRPVTEERAITLPTDYSLEDFVDSEENIRELHYVQTTSFMDYYDFHPLSLEAWIEQLSSGVNDKSLWRVMKYKGAMVGYLMGSNRYISEKFGYVASIGVLREHRSQGLAKALLLDAFNRDARLGNLGTILHGDSSNPTGAMKLYEHVGMVQDRAYVAYRKVITTR
jgi:ribosomal protein S18 acetylase RimI-like enzyme